MFKNEVLLIVTLFVYGGIFAQESLGPTKVINGQYLGETTPLRDVAIYNPENSGVNEITIIPNDYSSNYNKLVNGRSISKNIQRDFGTRVAVGIDQNFDAVSSTESTLAPTDPTGAAGPNHYVHAVNALIKVFDKEGNLLTGPTPLWSFFGVDEYTGGDPIIMYDQLADRFFVSQFGPSFNSLIFGVSTTNDPTGSYYIYEYSFNDFFPDYPHYSIWPDGYYLSVHEFNQNGHIPDENRQIYVLDREALLAGEENPAMLSFPIGDAISSPTTVFSGGPAHLTGLQFPENTPGFFSYLQDDAWSDEITQDHLKVWQVDIDWSNVNASTISAPQELPLDNFDAVFAQFSDDIEQPGTSVKLTSQSGIISYASNYRSFTDHNSWLITFNVDVDGNQTAGIRWIELRNTAEDSNWVVYQEGTYAPADGKNRFMSSGGIDERGNIGIAYSVGDASTPIGLSYTGRYADDPLGQLTLEETSIVDGGGVYSIIHRYGDYAHLTMDPDDFTFWFTSQYFEEDNVWTSRVTSFRLADEYGNDVGVIAINTPNDGILSATETAEITLKNFGNNPQSNFPVKLYVDDVLVANETYTGMLNSGDEVTYTFPQNIDLSIQGQTYVLRAETELDVDEFVFNDSFQKEVTNTFANDVGVVAILSPDESANIGFQAITATIENFGANPQSNFNVQYTVNGGTPVVEQLTGVTLAIGETYTHTFTTFATLEPAGEFIIEVKTNLTNDENLDNDTFLLTTQASFCIPTATGGDGGGIGCTTNGIKRFVLGDIDADDGGDGCNTEPVNTSSGYADRTTLSTTLSNQQGTNIYNLQAQTNWDDGVGVEVLSVWIDFNDNLIFEASEQLIAGEAFEVVDALDDFELIIPTESNIGAHILRVKAIDGSSNGDINNPCSNYDFGETHDYTVIINNTLGTNENELDSLELTVKTDDYKNFEIALETQLDGNVHVGVYNSLGQMLKYKKVKRTGNTFNLSLNMEAVTSGVYFVKMIAVDHNMSKMTKILVK